MVGTGGLRVNRPPSSLPAKKSGRRPRGRTKKPGPARGRAGRSRGQRAEDSERKRRRRPPPTGSGDERGDDEGDDGDELDEDVEARPGGVLQRVAHGVADDGGLVGV